MLVPNIVHIQYEGYEKSIPTVYEIVSTKNCFLGWSKNSKIMCPLVCAPLEFT